MTARWSASTGDELLCGDPAIAVSLAGSIESMGSTLAGAEYAARQVTTGRWDGRAAALARTRLGELPPVLTDAVMGFAAATAALDGWSEALTTGQTRADRAVAEHHLGERLTQNWIERAPIGEFRYRGSSGDPGSTHRTQAESDVADVRRAVDEAASECAARLMAAADIAYRHIGFWRALRHHTTEVAGGFADGVESFLQLPPALFEAGAWLLDTTPSNVEDRVERVAGFIDDVTDEPGAFVGQLVGWDTLIENPDRWAGQVVPDALLGAVGARVVSASEHAGELAAGIRRLHLDETGAIRPGSATASSAVNRLAMRRSLAIEQQMAEAGVVIGGNGHRRTVDVIGRLTSTHGGTVSDWVKKTSSTFVSEDGSLIQTHWFENLNTGRRVEMKVKMEWPGRM